MVIINEDIYVPTLKKDLNIAWGRVNEVIRHNGSNSKLYRVKLDDGNSVIVTEDHSLYVYKDGEITYILTTELKVGDYVITAKSEDIAFKSDSTEVKASTSRVLEIEPLKYEYDYVYDISVDETENFLVNNIVIHNSTFGFGLEHIADGILHMWMENVEEAKEVRRYMIIKKMRMTNHYRGAYRVDIIPGQGLTLVPLH